MPRAAPKPNPVKLIPTPIIAPNLRKQRTRTKSRLAWSWKALLRRKSRLRNQAMRLLKSVTKAINSANLGLAACYYYRVLLWGIPSASPATLAKYEAIIAVNDRTSALRLSNLNNAFTESIEKLQLLRVRCQKRVERRSKYTGLWPETYISKPPKLPK